LKSRKRGAPAANSRLWFFSTADPFTCSLDRWGEFEIQIRITFVPEAAEKPILFYHHLKLHPWTASGGDVEAPPPAEVAAQLGPVHSWQYDELVFTDPFQQFLNTLTAHPPTPLPKARRRPVPFHTANPGSLEASKGGVPEFTAVMEKDEIQRFDDAREEGHRGARKASRQSHGKRKGAGKAQEGAGRGMRLDH
jgi:YEATS domain-containing protein 4